MIRAFSTWLYRIASLKTLLPALALDILFMAYVMPQLGERMNQAAGHPVEPIDLLLFRFDPALIQQRVAGYGEAGRAVYAQGLLTADVAYPLVYSFLLAIALSLLFRNRAPFARVNALPLLVLAADLLENACISYLLKTYPAPAPGVAGACTVFSAVKWGGAFSLLALVVYGLVRRFLLRQRIQADTATQNVSGH